MFIKSSLFVIIIISHNVNCLINRNIPTRPSLPPAIYPRNSQFINLEFQFIQNTIISRSHQPDPKTTTQANKLTLYHSLLLLLASLWHPLHQHEQHHVYRFVALVKASLASITMKSTGTGGDGGESNMIPCKAINYSTYVVTTSIYTSAAPETTGKVLLLWLPKETTRWSFLLTRPI